MRLLHGSVLFTLFLLFITGCQRTNQPDHFEGLPKNEVYGIRAWQQAEAIAQDTGAAFFDLAYEGLRQTPEKYPELKAAWAFSLANRYSLLQKPDSLKKYIHIARSIPLDSAEGGFALAIGLMRSLLEIDPEKLADSILLSRLDTIQSQCRKGLEESHPLYARIIGQTNRLKGNYFATKGMHEQGLKLMFENLEMKTRNTDTCCLYLDWYSIGNTYYFLEDYKNSEKYMQKAAEKAQRQSDKINSWDIQARSLHFMAKFHRMRGDTTSWLRLTSECIAQFKAHQSQHEIPPLIDIAVYYITGSDYPRADSILARVDSVVNQGVIPTLAAGAIATKAQYALQKGNFAEASRLAKLAIDTDVHGQYHKDLWRLTAMIEEAKGDVPAAYTAFNRFFEAYRQSVNTESIRKTEEMNFSLLMKEKQWEAEALAEKQVLLSRKVHVQRWLTGVALVGLLLTVVLLVRVVRDSERLQKANDLLKSQSAEMQAAKEEAEKASRAKAEFLSVMSHEIRTPLNGVVGMANILLDENPRPDQLESLEVLRHASNHLLGLINDILDFSKIEAGKVQLEHISFNLPHLTHSVSRTFEPLASEKGIYLRTQIEPSLGFSFKGDPIRLGQILTNLVSNAVKFTHNGGVLLSVRSDTGQRIRFSVSDTGIGIDPDFQRQIFEEFTQASSETTRQYGGTGLGLTISRKLVEMMGGQLALRSTPGEGSEFFFSIPLEMANGLLEMPDDAGHTNATLPGLRILVVEDNQVNQKILGRFMKKWGIEMEVVEDGMQAVDAVERNDYHLILMDIHMPVMDGIEATRRIRSLAQPSKSGIPIIALTAAALPEEIMRMRQVQMTEIETKPFNPDTLFRKIMRHFPQ